MQLFNLTASLLYKKVHVMYVCFSAGVRNFAEALEKELEEKSDDEPATKGEGRKSPSAKESNVKEDEKNTKKDSSD